RPSWWPCARSCGATSATNLCARWASLIHEGPGDPRGDRRRAARRLGDRGPHGEPAALRAALGRGARARPAARAGFLSRPGRAPAPHAARDPVAYALAITAGLGCGFALGFNRLVGRAYGPILAALYAVPAVVWYPSLMLFFGLDAASKIAFGFLLGFFPITLAVLAGIRQVSPQLLVVARAF